MAEEREGTMSLYLRRFAAFLFVAMMMAACGGGEEPAASGEDGTGSGGDATEQAEETDAEPTETEAEGETAGETDDWDEVVEAAQEEGQLVWYGVPTERTLAAVSEAFEEEYGISVEFLRATTSDLTQRYAGEADAGAVNADLIVLNVGNFHADMIDAGHALPLQDAGIPGFPEEWPEEFTYPEFGTGIVTINPRGIVYNTDVVSEDEAPQSWDDLLDPKWESSIFISDPETSLVVTEMYDIMLDEFGEDYLRGLAPNIAGTFPSVVPLTEAVGAGEAPIGVGPNGLVVNEAQEQGAPLEFVLPDELGFGAEMAPLLSADAPHPNAARLFLHFLMFEEGHDVFVGEPGNVSPLGQADLPSGYRRPNPDAEERRDEILDLMGL